MNAQPGAGPLLRSPLVRIIRPSQIPREGREVEIVATPAQCAAIRPVLEVERLDALAAAMVLEPEEDGAIAVRGRVRARVGRRCVLTLKDFDSLIDETFSEVFRPQPAGPATGAGVTIDIDAGVDFETFTGDEIDLGSLVFQFLALALDPYPRAPGAPEISVALGELGLGKRSAAKITAGEAGETGETEKRQSPFAIPAIRGRGGQGEESQEGEESET